MGTSTRAEPPNRPRSNAQEIEVKSNDRYHLALTILFPQLFHSVSQNWLKSRAALHHKRPKRSPSTVPRR